MNSIISLKEAREKLARQRKINELYENEKKKIAEMDAVIELMKNGIKLDPQVLPTTSIRPTTSSLTVQLTSVKVAYDDTIVKSSVPILRGLTGTTKTNVESKAKLGPSAKVKLEPMDNHTFQKHFESILTQKMNPDDLTFTFNPTLENPNTLYQQKTKGSNWMATILKQYIQDAQQMEDLLLKYNKKKHKKPMVILDIIKKDASKIPLVRDFILNSLLIDKHPDMINYIATHPDQAKSFKHKQTELTQTLQSIGITISV